MRTPVNAQTLKQHITYSWWKYLLALIAGIFAVDLLFTVTAPQIPPEKKVNFYIYGYADGNILDPYLAQVRENEMPDMESLAFNTIMMDESYGQMQLTTYIAVGEGDVYLLGRDEFLGFSSGGVFIPLETDTELMAMFDAAGKNLRRGWRTASDSDEAHLYGIPADQLPALGTMCASPDGFLAVPASGRNIENAMKFLRILVRDTLEDPVPAEIGAAGETAGPSPAP